MRDLRGASVRTALGCLLVGASVLTGCSEKQEASTTLPATTTSAAPTSAPPVLGPADFPVPDEARTKDAAGAEAFLRYWIELLNRQRAIPAGEPLRDLGPNCQNCQRIAQNYEEAAAAGAQYEGGGIRIDVVADPTLDGDEVVISFLARQEAVQMVDSTGTPIDAGQPAAEDLSSGISMLWSAEERSWLVTGFDIG